jgi:tetratricopeptide (TPR) repeat protein
MTRYSQAAVCLLVVLLTATARGQDLLPAPADMKVDPAETTPFFRAQPSAELVGAKPAPGAAHGPLDRMILDEGDDHLHRARVNLEQGCYDAAVRDADSCLALYPSRIEALRIRAYCHAFPGLMGDKDSLDEGLADIERVLKLNPDDVPARAIRGVILINKGDVDHAIADLSYAIDRRVDVNKSCFDLDVASYRGIALMHKEEYEKAIEDFDRAASHYGVNPISAEVLANRGTCHAACGRDDQAIADLTLAIEQKPYEPWMLRSRAKCFAEKNDLVKALADHDQIVRLRPDDPQSYLDRSCLLWTKGENARAVADVDRLVQLCPKVGEAYLYRALMSILILHDWDRALADVNQAIILEPRCTIFYAVRSVIFAHKMNAVAACKDAVLCAVTLEQSEFKLLWQIDNRRERFFVAVAWRLKKAHPHRDVKALVATVEDQCLNLSMQRLFAATFGTGS